MSSYITAADLDPDEFSCCEEPDLVPFKCIACGQVMVFCQDCDTLFSDMSDLDQRGGPVNHFDPGEPFFHCPKCDAGIDYFFVNNPAHRVPRAEWEKDEP